MKTTASNEKERRTQSIGDLRESKLTIPGAQMLCLPPLGTRLDIAADTLEDEARKRAFAGSDVVLMFLLKGIRPQKWRESRATIAPAELNKMIEVELERIAKQNEAEATQPIN